MKSLRLAFSALCAVLLACPSPSDTAPKPDSGVQEPDASQCFSLCGSQCCELDETCNTSLLRCEKSCVGSCDGRQCGDDGCGHSCGDCEAGTRCVRNACLPCQSDCTNKVCGDDGCNGSCGSCSPGFSCEDFRCIEASGEDAGTSEPDAGGSGMSLEEMCDRMVDLQIARYSECIGGPLEAWALSFDKAESCRSLQASARSGRTRYVADRAPACLAWYQSVGCEQLISSQGTNPCNAVFLGLVPDHGACYSLTECQSGWCVSGPEACPGVCKARIAEGEACALTDWCEPGLSCANGTCQHFGAQGDPCGGPTGVACSYPSLYCQGSTSTAPGTCRPKQTSGSCSQVDACALRHVCVGLSYYPATPGTCVPQKTVGDACTPGGRECETYSSCSAEGACAIYGQVGDSCGLAGSEYAMCLDSWCQVGDDYRGTCVPYREPGEACSQTEWSPCGSGGVCDETSLQCVPACRVP